MPNQEAEERSCRDFEDLKTKICIYARDMKLQGISVTFEKVGDRKSVRCPQTGLVWTITSRVWKHYDLQHPIGA